MRHIPIEGLPDWLMCKGEDINNAELTGLLQAVQDAEGLPRVRGLGGGGHTTQHLHRGQPTTNNNNNVTEATAQVEDIRDNNGWGRPDLTQPPF
eukprot:805989-Prorocentrum_minimum.AAC.1